MIELNCLTLVKGTFVLILTSCFILHVREMVKMLKETLSMCAKNPFQFAKFIQRKTATIELKREVSGRIPPQFTICVHERPFKDEDGLHFNETTYNSNVYQFEEIFHPNALNYLEEKVSKKAKISFI